MDWSGFLAIVKTSGPTIAVLLGIIWLQWRHIDRLLQRNADIYESHLKSLYETQDRLLTQILGPRTSSQEMPTMKQLQEKAGDPKTANDAGGEKK